MLTLDLCSGRFSNTSMPSGCLMLPAGAGQHRAIFNQARSTVDCAPKDRPSGAFVWEGPFNNTAIGCGAGGCLPSDPK